ncbi:hypothetical protein G6F62_014263 [Rhizopus arrhizus]|nr:hypothetical protein G6F62_014263 [Rhizopus arrhizus]
MLPLALSHLVASEFVFHVLNVAIHRNGRVVSSASPASDTLLNINTESVDSSASVITPASTQGLSSALAINTTVSTTTPTTVQVGQEITPAVDHEKSILNSAGHDTATELDDLSHQSAADDVDIDGTSSEPTIDYAPAVTRSPAPSPNITGSAATDPAFPDTTGSNA